MKQLSSSDAQTPEDAKVAILNYIDERLCEWATWAQSGYRLGIGYPPCSLEYRLMTEGHFEREYHGLAPTPEHAAAEEMEALICEMTAQCPKMAEVIRIHYLEKEGYSHKARRMGMSITLFKTHLNTGRWWLAGWLSSKNKVKALET
jgi:hypothetical protein